MGKEKSKERVGKYPSRSREGREESFTGCRRAVIFVLYLCLDRSSGHSLVSWRYLGTTKGGLAFFSLIRMHKIYVL